MMMTLFVGMALALIGILVLLGPKETRKITILRTLGKMMNTQR